MVGIKEGEKQTSMHASEKEKLQRMKTVGRGGKSELEKRRGRILQKSTAALGVNKAISSVARGRPERLCILINEFQAEEKKN